MSKYCVNCGQQLDDDDVFCGECGAKQTIDSVDESYEINDSPNNEPIEEDVAPPSPAKREAQTLEKPLKQKNKTIAGLLAILLGWCGAHWFYLGKPIRAIIYFVVYLIIPYTWLLSIAEGVFFLIAKKESFDKYRRMGGIYW